MDIYNYFSSPDVAAHCEKIGHVFSPLEMAVIVVLSHKTIKEKHAAYRDIITDYPDMPIPRYSFFNARDSLHEFLREYIAWEEKKIADFYALEDNAVYRPYVTWSPRNRSDVLGCYSTAKKAWGAICEKYDWEEEEVLGAEIIKEYIDMDRKFETWFNSDGELLWIERVCWVNCPECPGELDMIFIHIPLSFKKGDLVEFVGDPMPCVLRDLPHWHPERYEERLARRGGDNSDMIAVAYIIDEDSNLNYDDTHSFYELKYFTGELKGQERFLRFLSASIKSKDGCKGECYDHLINAFNKLKAEAEYEETNNRLGDDFSWWSEQLEVDDAKHAPGQADGI